MNNAESTRPTLVLIHAFPFDSSMWEPQRTALAEHADICTPDLPGFGGEPRLDGESLSMELAARRVQYELDARGIDRCILGGLSMGGYVTFECWRLFPERIAGLILADTKASADSDEARKGRYEAVERIGRGEYADYVDGLMEKLLSGETRSRHPEMVDRVRSLALRTLPEVAMSALLGMAVRKDSNDILSTIDVPTALIFGEHDSITNVDEGRAMAAAIPDAKLTIIPGAGHLSNIESPEAFNAAAADLLMLCSAGTVSDRNSK